MSTRRVFGRETKKKKLSVLSVLSGPFPLNPGVGGLRGRPTRMTDRTPLCPIRMTARSEA